jgi:hypothetical protein
MHRDHIQRALPIIKEKRAALKRSMETIDGAPAASWDTVSGKVSHAWDELKTALDDASP